MVNSPGTNGAEAYHNWADLRDVLFNLVRKPGPQQWTACPCPRLVFQAHKSLPSDVLHLPTSRWPSGDHSMALVLL